MSLRHAVLGLLTERPASGYDLLKLFDTSLAHVWPATQSQIYTELTKLAGAGLIAVTNEGPRGRKDYTITDEGLDELRRWLTETEPQPNARSETMLRVFFLGVLSRDEACAYLAHVHDLSTGVVENFRRLAESITWDEDAFSLYGRLVLEYAMRFHEMRQEWAQWAMEEVARTKRTTSARQAAQPQPK
jgi:DNA-binding PadR family transcriptional regulator